MQQFGLRHRDRVLASQVASTQAENGLREDGQSLQEIAGELGRSKSDVARVVRPLSCADAGSAPAMLV